MAQCTASFAVTSNNKTLVAKGGSGLGDVMRRAWQRIAHPAIRARRGGVASVGDDVSDVRSDKSPWSSVR